MTDGTRMITDKERCELEFLKWVKRMGKSYSPPQLISAYEVFEYYWDQTSRCGKCGDILTHEDHSKVCNSCSSEKCL